ncbi:MAG: GNAT family N-acetyltransferase [Smithellaceae bacterium]
MAFIPIIEQTYFANARHWGTLNASLSHVGSIGAMKTGIDSADLNMAWNETPLTPGDAGTIEDIKQSFYKDNLPFWWWVFPVAKSPTTLSMLQTQGFTLVERIPCMLADTANLPIHASRNRAITVTLINTLEDLRRWEEVSFTGFDFPPETRRQYRRFVDTFQLAPESPQKFFLACINDKPVATSLLFMHENAGGIYFVTTLAEERGKGIGLEITQATMRFAKMAGARYATLQSSPDGLPVYQRAGFREYCLVDVYGLTP